MTNIDGRIDWRSFYACDGFPLLYPRGFLLPFGAYNHILNLGNIPCVWRRLTVKHCYSYSSAAIRHADFIFLQALDVTYI